MKKRILLIIIFVCFFIWYFFARHDDYEIVQTLAETTAGEITMDVSLEQTFVAERSNLSAVEIFFGTYNRTNSSDLVVQLIDNNGKSILNETINTSDLKDNQFEVFSFSRIEDSKGRLFTILIESKNAFSNNAITVWTSQNDSYSEGDLLINKINVGRDITFKTTHSNNELDFIKEKIAYFPVNKITIIFVFIGIIICSIMLMYMSMETNYILENKE